MGKEEVLDVIERWEATGLLYGLPIYEKEELSLIFDNVTRVLLSKDAMEKIPEDVYEILNEVIFPVTRRLYRRVGVRFDVEEMLSELMVKVNDSIEDLKKPVTKENNPIVKFSIDFADGYEDEETNKKMFTKEQYEKRVDKTLEYVKKVLLSEEKVGNIDRLEKKDWSIKFLESKSTESATRVWNQKMALQLLQSVISDTNRGI